MKGCSLSRVCAAPLRRSRWVMGPINPTPAQGQARVTEVISDCSIASRTRSSVPVGFAIPSGDGS